MKKFSKALHGSAAPLALVLGGISVTGMVAVPAVAQDYTNVSATGRVIGTDGQPIEGATVTIVSNAQGFSRTVTTNNNGSYRIQQIPPGRYTVTVSAPGYDSFTDPDVSLNQDGAANQYALAPSGALGGEIVVMAGRTEVVDFDRTTTGAVINVGELASRVPVARDLTSIIELSPGTSQGDAAFGNLASVGGASVSENAFYINGLNVTDFRKGLGSSTVPFDFYETVEVKNGGYQAEFGRSTGGFINATTKSGSNEYHASILFNWQPDGLRSDSPSSRNPDDGSLRIDNSLDSESEKDVVVQLSGPIIKDRLFFYGLYNFRDREYGRGLALNSQFENNYSDSPFWGVKVDPVPIDGHRLEFTYFDTSGERTLDNYSYDPETDDIGGYVGSELQEYGGSNYVVRYTGNFTDWFTLSAAYGKNKQSDNVTADDTSFPYIVDYRERSAGQVIGNSVNLLETGEDEREFYRFDADLYVDFLGSHHFRAGYDHEDLTSNNLVSYTGDAAYSILSGSSGDVYAPAGVDYVSVRTFRSGGIFDTTNEAFYIQDNWSLMNDRLQLQLGLRNDRFTNRDSEGNAFYESGDQWAPRVGFTFDVFDDGRAKIYGSFGRYYLPIQSNTNVRLSGPEFDQTRYNRFAGFDSNGVPILGDPLIGFTGSDTCLDTGIDNCEVISTGEAAPLDSVVAKNLKPQSKDEYILGGEMRVGNHWVFGLYGTYRSLNESLEDVAVDTAVRNYCAENGYDTDACNDTWFGYHQYVLLNPGSDATITLSDPLPGETEIRTLDLTAEQLAFPKAKHTYKAITATFEREFDGVWELQGSYTYSQTKGNIEGGVKSDNGQDDAGITTGFDVPGLALGSYGYLPTHRAHNFKLFGSYQVTDWFTLGGNVQLESPRKFGCIGRIRSDLDEIAPLYGAESWYCHVDGSGNVITDPEADVDRGNGTTQTPRGSQFESDWFNTVNLTAVFKLPITSFDSSLRVDVFNVFNSSAKLDFEERGTQDNGQPRADYGVPLSWQTPRYVRFQLKMGF
ncbi:TonB-dependent receptor [Altericroceibacterium spongiae]|uniref:TonB-dependent receptor n=1 Tax=Altericroceibacterium spongiae TaxID=2320269 RepID=A0A420ENT4_9SPHN|nr:TonB-dependent receptor [Altericroceibacterium spongiae]RKF22323.1 TonB-dependent receptor [Altericroceibacterium spongiae]